MFDGMGTSASQIRAGKLNALGVATPKRLEDFPNVPTSAEIGVPNWQVSTWYGLWAVKGTPQPIIDRMYAEVAKALKNERVVALWKEKAADAGGEPPAEFNKRVHAECQKWAKVVAEAKVSID
jgi:tripartite-type tricarboxylate transporter receptor subunit TctC